ncbi:MAG: hypothetical protein NTY19_18505 [Planctomycetota bacterium]|nr:hypothetical protein [Planctomycetota bacterium]
MLGYRRKRLVVVPKWPRKNNLNDWPWDGLAIRPVFPGQIANPSYMDLILCPGQHKFFTGR